MVNLCAILTIRRRNPKQTYWIGMTILVANASYLRGICINRTAAKIARKLSEKASFGLSYRCMQQPQYLIHRTPLCLLFFLSLLVLLSKVSQPLYNECSNSCKLGFVHKLFWFSMFCPDSTYCYYSVGHRWITTRIMSIANHSITFWAKIAGGCNDVKSCSETNRKWKIWVKLRFNSHLWE